MIEDIKQALRSAGLSQEDVEQYWTLLHEHGYDTERLLRFVTPEVLSEIGVHKSGHRKAVMSAVSRLQRTKVAKRHVFYIVHDKVDSGTEASMFVDVAALRFSDKPAFIDSDHKYLRSFEDHQSAMLASNFCLVLLTPRLLQNQHCLTELVWAHQSETPICTVLVERAGLERLPVANIPTDLESIKLLLSDADWAKMEKLGITADHVRAALLHILSSHIQASGYNLVFQPHESREVRAGFFTMLWRFTGEMAATEAGSQVFALDQRVDVRWKRGDRWYPGRVSYIAPNGTYSIEYFDGDRETGVTADYMQRHKQPPVVVFHQDERVEGRWKRRNAYFPGRIVAVYENMDAYDIVYDDGDIEYRVSYEMLKKLGD